MLPFYGAYLVTDRQLAPALVAVVVGSFAVGALVADATITGVLSALSPRATIVIAMVVQCVALALTATLDSPVALIAATVLWGFCFEVVNPTAFAIVTRVVPEEHQRVGFSAVRLAVNVGMGVGPAVGSLVFAVAPQLLFVINGVLGLAAGGTLLFWASSPAATGASAHGSGERWWGGVRDELRIWSFLLVTFPVHLAFALPTTVLSLYIVDELRLPSYVAGAVFVLNAALIIALELPLNIAMNHWRNSSLIATGCLFAGTGFAATGLFTAAWLIVALTVVWTLGEMIIAPAFLSYVKRISPDGLVTRNLGLFTADINVGVLVAPGAYIYLRDTSAPGGVWAVAGVLTLLTALVMLLLGLLSATEGRPSIARVV